MCISFVFRAQMSHCLFLSSDECRFCCVPFLDNALHIQRRQPVGTWRCNTFPSCTRLLISPLTLFFVLFCMETLYSHLLPSSWLQPALYFGSCMSSACWGFSVPPCSFCLVSHLFPLCFQALEPWTALHWCFLRFCFRGCPVPDGRGP